MTSLWTAQDVAAVCGGECTAHFDITGLSIDSRALAPGDLFIALTAARDGHDFVAQALAAGAAGALVSRRPAGLAADAPLIIVDDVLPALEALARAARERTRARIVGVTGSVGKTSSKEMLRTILGRQGRVHAAEASFNNHWGVPLTLARMPADADYAVIEIGMNRPGEIAPLSRLARPHVALITTVAPAHLEAFESLEGIAHEKAAILEGLVPGGTAVLPADLEVSPILIAKADACGAQKILFGRAVTADFRLGEVTLARDATVVAARSGSRKLLFKVASAGRHFAENALGCLAVAEALGADLTVAALDIGLWQPPAGRGLREVVVLDQVDDHLRFELIDDAFNANPASLDAALEVLAAAEPADGIGRVSGGRRIAVLGDMLELGVEERALHVAVAAHPALKKVDRVHCVGPRMRHLWEALPLTQRGEWVERAQDLAARARHLVDAGDIVLVKGSKSSHVSLVVDALRNLGQADADQTRGMA
ncbi:UDP-N-acetylmuramoyl-tripeptide--D-alanyl-D-alanine ligase [Plastorhodobacter daqingensis]|uniref:UDP-N-acetylmuramoyl-tripeptide--D-alanyl-D-alanine ligase n=1 Tax=Plastorhodobacter daqingensis TaxID=1387281 RepID=A0ABW2UJ78_9RHOB